MAGEKAFSNGIDLGDVGKRESSEDIDNVTRYNAGLLEKLVF